jgi:hypothetical protein
LIWNYDEVSDKIIIFRKPMKFSEAFWGLGRELWEKEGADAHVKKEREGWE